jgi:hypothetical protein
MMILSHASIKRDKKQMIFIIPNRGERERERERKKERCANIR